MSVKKTRLNFLKFIQLGKFNTFKMTFQLCCDWYIKYISVFKIFYFFFWKTSLHQRSTLFKNISEFILCEATNNQQLYIRNKIITRQTFFGLQDVLKLQHNNLSSEMYNLSPVKTSLTSWRCVKNILKTSWRRNCHDLEKSFSNKNKRDSDNDLEEE